MIYPFDLNLSTWNQPQVAKPDNNLLDVQSELSERDQIIQMQANRITELENEVARLTFDIKMLLEYTGNQHNQIAAITKPREYTKGQRVAFCVNYGRRKVWDVGIVAKLGKQGVKVAYQSEYQKEKGTYSQRWVKPEYVKPYDEESGLSEHPAIVDVKAD
jgi:hypothetical protein